MNQDILDFYNGKNLQVQKLIEVGQREHGLQPLAIRKAAEAVHTEIMNGMEIKDTQIAWRVFAHAKRINAFALKEGKAIEELQGELKIQAELARKYKDLCETLACTAAIFSWANVYYIWVLFCQG